MTEFVEVHFRRGKLLDAHPVFPGLDILALRANCNESTERPGQCFIQALFGDDQLGNVDTRHHELLYPQSVRIKNRRDSVPTPASFALEQHMFQIKDNSSLTGDALLIHFNCSRTSLTALDIGASVLIN